MMQDDYMRREQLSTERSAHADTTAFNQATHPEDDDVCDRMARPGDQRLILHQDTMHQNAYHTLLADGALDDALHRFSRTRHVALHFYFPES